MGRNAQPVNLLIAKGNSHLSKREIEERRARELKVPFTDVQPPEYLTGKQKREFEEIANKLLALDVFTELDVDCLARYVIANGLYVMYSAKQVKASKDGDIVKEKEMQNLADKSFRQARACACDLGLTPTSRCKLVIPSPPEDDDEL